jgi:DNA modification methylase
MNDTTVELTTQEKEYNEFLLKKRQAVKLSGFEVNPESINTKLFLFQRDIVRWALNLGKAAIFAECGLGKTGMQLEWAKHVAAHTGGKVLILAPLAVGEQTVREGVKFDVPVIHVREQSEVGEHNIVVTNYERLHLFESDKFSGVVLDESSILKSFTGKTKKAIIDAFKTTPYKLACTATPAPNDHLELGNHADFLDIMPSNEMISRWFINDTMSAGSYRLKGHAAKDFWRWLTSWAVAISLPSDLGQQYDMPEFVIPPLNIQEHLLGAAQASIDRAQSEGRLFPDNSPSATELHKVKRESLSDRIDEAVKIVAAIPEIDPVLIWCDTNYEADALIKAFPEAIEVRGNHSMKIKEERLRAFSLGETRMLITKPDIAGFGLNWQHCNHQIFVGVSYSFEKTYQALRRSWRFGQKNPVQADLIYAETEGNIMVTLKEKQEAFKTMQTEMNEAMTEHGLFRDTSRLNLVTAQFEKESSKNWTLYLGDCVPVTKILADNSIDFSVYSPPFANLYIYSDSEADMGNSASDDEFFDHYEYLIQELYRVTLPGRLSAVHCKDLPAYMNRDGAAGLRDFPGEIIRRHEKHGWQYHSRITIWKDPVIEMQRTKNHGLLHKNFTDRSEACRQGMPDYVLVFRKWPIDGGREIKQVRQEGDYIGTKPPTENELQPRTRNREDNYSISVWQRYASPVWYDIDQTNVLNFRIARDNEDEKHICPLQLDVIARCIDIWSAPGETVFSPFAGVGSEGWQALKQDRKFVGVELKRSYYETAIEHLREMERQKGQVDLFEFAGIEI